MRDLNRIENIEELLNEMTHMEELSGLQGKEYLVAYVKKLLERLSVDPLIFKTISNLYNSKDESDILSPVMIYPEKFIEFYNKWIHEEYRPIEDLSKEGIINLDGIARLRKGKARAGSCVIDWYFTKMGDILIKYFPPNAYLNEDFPVEFKNDIFRYCNVLIAPEIAKQFRIESAQYFLGKSDRKDGIERMYSLTPSFLKEDEELINAYDILESKRDIISWSVGGILGVLGRKLSYRFVDETSIQKINFDVLKQTFFNKVIKNTDDVYNWGIILKKDNSMRLAPAFDFDFSFDIYTARKRQRLSSNYSTRIEDFMRDYKSYPGFQQFVQDCIKNFDINEIFMAVEQKHGINLDEVGRAYYAEFLERQMDIVKTTYRELYTPDIGIGL